MTSASCKRGQTCLLRGFLRHFAGDGKARVAQRHVEPGAALADGVALDRDLVPGLFAECGGQRGCINCLGDDDLRRNRAVQIMLREKGFQRLVRRDALAILREQALVAQMTAAAYHQQVDAEQAVFRHQRHHVDIGAGCGCRQTASRAPRSGS